MPRIGTAFNRRSQGPCFYAGKTAIVTGAARGLGREIARQMASLGACVLIVDLPAADPGKVAAEIGAAGWMALDVTDRTAMESAVTRVVAERGQLDLMFNNAGLAMFGAFEDQSLDDLARVVDVNLRGELYGTAIAYRQMVQQGHGHIVNVASLAGLVPVQFQAGYCATKFGIFGMSAALGLEARRHGVNITAFCPGFIDSGSADAAGKALRASVPIRPMTADRAVARLLHGVARRREVVVTPLYGRLDWLFGRLSPTGSRFLHYRLVRRIQAHLPS